METTFETIIKLTSDADDGWAISVNDKLTMNGLVMWRGHVVEPAELREFVHRCHHAGISVELVWGN